MPMEDNEHKSILSSINSPDDLRRLAPGQLPALCTDIRKFLIDSLSTNPGHFASGMGAVELTVALHYVFNTPYDRIVWDIRHIPTNCLPDAAKHLRKATASSEA